MSPSIFKMTVFVLAEAKEEAKEEVKGCVKGRIYF